MTSGFAQVLGRLRPRRRRQVPIYLFCHHKVATVLLTQVFRDLCARFGWRFERVLGRRAVPDGADIVLFMHSGADPAVLPGPFVGAHFIRDPRDVIVSGFLFHRRCDEGWCVNTDFDDTSPIGFPQVPYSQEHRPESWKREYLAQLGGRSYQQNLRERSDAEALSFEMARYGGWTTEDMLAWNYQHPAIAEFRYEELMAGYDAGFERLFRHCGLDAGQLATALSLAAAHDLSRKTDAQIRSNRHVSSREASKWRKFFQPVHEQEFADRFGDAVSRLGYAE